MQAAHATEASSRTISVMGTVTRFLLTAKETGGQFTLYRISGPVGCGVPMHVHAREDETFLIRSGQVKFVVQDKVIVANAGDVVFGPRGVPHSWEAVGAEGCVFDVITTPSGMETMFEELGALAPGAPMSLVLGICERAGISFL